MQHLDALLPLFDKKKPLWRVARYRTTNVPHNTVAVEHTWKPGLCYCTQYQAFTARKEAPAFQTGGIAPIQNASQMIDALNLTLARRGEICYTAHRFGASVVEQPDSRFVRKLAYLGYSPSFFRTSYVDACKL